jgi:hypothetical protein
MNEYIAAAIVWLDKTVAALPVEKLDRSSHGHRQNSSRRIASAAASPRADGPDIHSPLSRPSGNEALRPGKLRAAA